MLNEFKQYLLEIGKSENTALNYCDKVKLYKTISILSPLIQKAITKIRVDSMNQILNIIFVKLYMDYDLEEDFFPQFIANRDMMIKMMNDLPIYGGE